MKISPYLCKKERSMENEKKVLIPIDEYEKLVQTKEDFEKLRKEFEKDCKERGLYVKHELVFRPSILIGCSTTDEVAKALVPRLTIYTKDEVLQEAQKEMERISSLSETFVRDKGEEADKAEAELTRMKKRNLWQRIWNK